MTTFFHVDRLNKLSQGMTCELYRHSDVKPDFLQSHVDSLFPEGFTNHGEFYLLKRSSHPCLVNPQIELFFEYVRRAHFRDRPSRFQAIFAAETIDQAKKFRADHCGGNGRIWEIDASCSFRADMSLLTMGTSILCASWFAHQYWQGAGGDKPFWEFLVLPPVTVRRIVE